jgi:DNA helicase-2/ATP-dependent DNA helicase PcrA
MRWDQSLDPNSPAYGIALSRTRFNRVIAGPGTGKSFALKRRVARLLEESADPERILPVTFTNVAAEDLQREMMRVGAPGCEHIRGSTFHSLCMRILSRENVLQAVGRTPRPLNKFEIEPLLYDLSTKFGNKRKRSTRIRAYEAAWARLPGDNGPGVLFLTSSRSMSLADAMQSGIRPANVQFGRALVHASRFIRELGPAAPKPEAG